MSTEYTAGRTSIRTAAILVIFAFVFTAAMALTYSVTKPDIDAAVAEVKRNLIAEVLPPASYDNALLEDVVMLAPTAELGLDEGGHVYRARRAGQPVALIVEARAPDGYGGAIDLIVAVRADGGVSGVRTTAHKETPGLGDYIERRKDPNKAAPFIDQFEGTSLAALPREQWQVRKDGGRFDARAGATISARAVVGAVARALEWTLANRERLFDARAGEALAATSSGAQ